MIKKIYKYIAASVFLWLPAIVLASNHITYSPAGPGYVDDGRKDLSDIIYLILNYINIILVLLIGLAVLIFIWYVIQYFIRPDTNKAEGGKHIMYSLIGFFIILSFWGLINIIQNTFELDNDGPNTWQEISELFPGGRGSNSRGFPSGPPMD